MGYGVLFENIFSKLYLQNILCCLIEMGWLGLRDEQKLNEYYQRGVPRSTVQGAHLGRGDRHPPQMSGIQVDA